MRPEGRGRWAALLRSRCQGSRPHGTGRRGLVGRSAASTSAEHTSLWTEDEGHQRACAASAGGCVEVRPFPPPRTPMHHPAWVGAHGEGSPSSLRLPPGSRLAVARATARAGELPGCPGTRPTGPERPAGARACTSTAWAAGRCTHVPFSTLREQGSSKMFLTLGQAACVFQVLAKAAAVPSTTPLRARRSSAWFWLKFPQRPGPGVGMA